MVKAKNTVDKWHLRIQHWVLGTHSVTTSGLRYTALTAFCVAAAPVMLGVHVVLGVYARLTTTVKVARVKHQRVPDWIPIPSLWTAFRVSRLIEEIRDLEALGDVATIAEHPFRDQSVRWQHEAMLRHFKKHNPNWEREFKAYENWLNDRILQLRWHEYVKDAKLRDLIADLRL